MHSSSSHLVLILFRFWSPKDISSEYDTEHGPLSTKLRVSLSNMLTSGRSGKEENVALVKWRVFRNYKHFIHTRLDCSLFLTIGPRTEAEAELVAVVKLVKNWKIGDQAGLDINWEGCIGREKFTKAGRNEEWQDSTFCIWLVFLFDIGCPINKAEKAQSIDTSQPFWKMY